jgi:hypothetical protein
LYLAEDTSSLRRSVSAVCSDSVKRDLHGGIRADVVEGPGSYYIGIIDVLQRWNWKKRLERWFKVYFKLLDREGISAVSPSYYANRFWRRVVLDTFEGLNDLPSDPFAEYRPTSLPIGEDPDGDGRMLGRAEV